MSKLGNDPSVPANITYNQQNGTYSMNPQNPQVKKKGSIQFNASNQACTLCFNPTNTVFGASLTVNTGAPQTVDVGDSDYSVGYCITNSGGTCPAPAPSKLADDNTGTIKVGSGGGMGDGHGHSKH